MSQRVIDDPAAAGWEFDADTGYWMWKGEEGTGGGGLWEQNGDDIYYSDGNVGIGATAYGNDPLRVELDDGQGLALGTREKDGTFYLGMKQNAGSWNNGGYLKWEQSSNVNDLTINAGGGDMKFITANEPYKERMTINADGNVGIGKSPTEKLTVMGNINLNPASASAADRLAPIYIGKRDSGTSGWMANIGFEGAGNNGFATNMTFSTRGGDNYNSVTTERMRISTDGKVGIGVNDPQKNLTVQGVSGRRISLGDSGTPNVSQMRVHTDNDTSLGYMDYAAYSHTFSTGTGATGTERMRIDADGSTTFKGSVTVDGDIRGKQNVIAYYSDVRLKDIQGPIENPVEKVKAIETFYYTHSDRARELGYEGSEIQVGVSAQSVQAVAPELIHRAPVDDDGEGGSVTGESYMTVDYPRLVPLLIECVKQLSAELEELKK